MRDIKFRVFHIPTKFLCEMEEISHCYFRDFKYIVMQYIGLQDKNGKGIYEGDIIKYKVDYDKKTWHKAVVEVEDLILGCPLLQYDEYSNLNVNWNTITVIGNIYENSELLKGISHE